MAVIEPIKMLVTEGPGAPKDGKLLKTQEGQPDIIAVARPIWHQVAMRSYRTGLQALVSAASLAGIATLTADASLPAFGKAFLICVLIGMVAAFWSAVQNTIELLGKYDKTAPSLRG